MTWKRALLICAGVVVLLCAGAGVFLWHTFGTFEVDLPDSLRSKTAGGLERVERVADYPAFLFRALQDWTELPEPVEINFGATLYRVRYWTTDSAGSLTLASGLLVIPKSAERRGTVCYLHGTNPNRHTTPSQPSLGEGVLGAAIFASNGYVFLAPDYIGLGVSQEVHPYLHAKTTSRTVADFLKASSGFTAHTLGEWPTSLYLLGFSQGGHATMAVQRALEAMDDARFQVVASAPVAGPHSLRDISLAFAFEGRSNASSMYLGYLANAYASVYGQALNSLLKDAHAERCRVLFDGEHDPDTVMASLPANPRELFREDFLAAFDGGKKHWFLDALKENQVLNWTPKAPVRAYYGEQDVDVSPEEAQRLAEVFAERGADARCESVGPYAHDESILYAAPSIREWFDEQSGG